MWMPDEELLEQTLTILRDVLGRPSAQEPSEDEFDLQDLLEAAGTLAFMGQEQRALAELPASDPEFRSSCTATVEAIDPFAIHAAVMKGLLLAEELEGLVEEDLLTAHAEQVLDRLGELDRLTLVLEGARLIIGEQFEIPLEMEGVLLSMEDILEEEGWRFLPLGAHRHSSVTWASPEMRAKLWWHSRGLDLPADSLEHLDSAAQIIHHFSGARGRLDELVEAAAILEAATQPVPAMEPEAHAGAESNVVSLWERFENTINAILPQAQEPALAAAAAVVSGGEPREDLLVEGLGGLLDVSWSSADKTLILDYREDVPIPDDRVPWLNFPGGKQPSETCQDPGRFLLSSSGPAFQGDHDDLELHVPLMDGGVATLPFTPEQWVRD